MRLSSWRSPPRGNPRGCAPALLAVSCHFSCSSVKCWTWEALSFLSRLWRYSPSVGESSGTWGAFISEAGSFLTYVAQKRHRVWISRTLEAVAASSIGPSKCPKEADWMAAVLRGHRGRPMPFTSRKLVPRGLGLFRVPWTARRTNQSILKEISPEYSLEGLI